MTRDKAVCPWCGREQALRSDRTFTKHGFRKNLGDLATHKPKPCEGSGRSPDIANEDGSRPALRLRTSIV